MKYTEIEARLLDTLTELGKTRDELDKYTRRWNRAVREIRKLKKELDTVKAELKVWEDLADRALV